MTQEIYQKQFSIGRILSESWQKYTENFQAILIITLIVYIPINIVLFFVPIELSLEGLKLYARAVQILEMVIGIIATMAIAYIIQNKINGKTIRTGEAFKKSLSRWGVAVGTHIILGFFLFGLTLLLVVPGIIFHVYWIFTLFAVILHDRSGKDALDYSKKIVKGRWWTVAGYLIIFEILGFMIVLMGQIPYWFLPENILTNIVPNMLMDVLFSALIDVFFSFFTVVFTVFFINFDSTKRVEVMERDMPSSLSSDHTMPSR